MANDYTGVKKDATRLDNRMFIFAAVCVIVALIAFAVLYIVGAQTPYSVIESEGPPLSGTPFAIDENAVPYAGTDVAAKGDQGCMVADDKSVTIKANSTDMDMLLLNPEGNAFNCTFEIELTNPGVELYKSGFVEPGMCIDGVAISRGLAKGHYSANLIISEYTPQGDNKINSRVEEFELIAE